LKLNLLWILTAVAVVGCSSNKSGTGPAIEALGDLNPNAKIADRAIVKIAEIDIPVEVVQSDQGGDLKLQLEAYGQVFEREQYKYDDKSFNLVDAAGESYEPPLPLLKFPMRVGDTFTWKGRMTAGTAPHEAEAKISISTDKLIGTATGPQECILVVVDLSIESGASKPATRKLRFWFVKDKGLLKRQFGIGSTREPVE